MSALQEMSWFKQRYVFHFYVQISSQRFICLKSELPLWHQLYVFMHTWPIRSLEVVLLRAPVLLEPKWIITRETDSLLNFWILALQILWRSCKFREMQDKPSCHMSVWGRCSQLRVRGWNVFLSLQFQSIHQSTEKTPANINLSRYQQSKGGMR